MTWRRTTSQQTEAEPTGCAPEELQLLAAPVVDGPHELEWSAMTDTVMRVADDRAPSPASPPPLRLLSQPDVFAMPSGSHLRWDICVAVCQQIAWAAAQATQNEWVVLAWGAPVGDDGHSWEMNATAFSAAPHSGLCSTAVLCREFMRVRHGKRASFGVPPGSTLLAVSRAMGLLEPIMVRFAKRDGIAVDNRARALDILFADGQTATIVLDADSEQLRYVRCSAALPIERSQYDLAPLDPSSRMTGGVELPKPGGPSPGQMVAGYLGDGATRVLLPSTLFNILSVADEELGAIKLP